MRRLLFRLLAVGVLLAPRLANADQVADARGLYDQGAAAYDAGDYARAAALLGDADALSPNPLVLTLALRAAGKTGDAVLAEDLALRVDARGASGDLATSAAQTHERCRAKVGRIRVVCDASVVSCTARLGSLHWSGGEIHAVAPGIVDVAFDGAAAHVRIEVAAGTVADLVQPPAPAAPSRRSLPAVAPAPTPTPTRASHGLPPWVFWTGAITTGALAAASTASAVDAQSHHDAFVASRNVVTQQSGEAAEQRTNVLLGVTVGVAVVTTAIGIFATRWHSSSSLAWLAAGRVSF